MHIYINKTYLPVYFFICVIFYYLFTLIQPLIISDRVCTPHVIDVHPYKCNAYFKSDYIITAKKDYNHSGYKEVYFPLDTVFPLVYSLLFMSIASYLKAYKSYKRLYCPMIILIAAAALFDYGENISFFNFLDSTNNSLAGTVAFFSTIKTFLFGASLVLSFLIWLIFGLIIGIISMFKKKTA